MSSLFWGLKLEPGKRYSTTVDKSFHISMATLDSSSVSNDNEVVSVILEEAGEGGQVDIFYLTNLRKKDTLFSHLDLNFLTGDRITLSSKGKGVVHLTGFMVLDDDDDELSGTMLDDEAEEEEDEEIDDSFVNSLKALGNKKNKTVVTEKSQAGSQKRKYEIETANKSKKKKLEVSKLGKASDSDEELDDEDEDDADMIENINLDDDEEDSDAEEEDEDGEEEEEDDDEEDDGEEEEEESPVIKQAASKKQKVQEQQQPKQKQKNKAAVQEQQGSKKQQQKPQTPNGIASPGGKQQNAQQAKSKSSISPGKQQGTPQPTENKLTGGVRVKDVKTGNGPVAKSGKMAVVYYSGRLKSTGKVFDSLSEGSGFKFKIGGGEVIKGWDTGIVGMKVGGKRVITCPPQMGYGQKGAPPKIPPNSTLVFEVELKGIH